MTNTELSNEFDVLYDSITSKQAPGLDEYEKSVFLTKAQYDILKAYFNPKGNKFQEGFDMSAKRQIDFSSLMRTITLKELNLTEEEKFDSRSKCYSTPSDLFISINEKCVDTNTNYVITPISYSEYDSLMLKPYQYPIKRQVWRLLTGKMKGSMSTPVTYIGDDSVEHNIQICNSSNKTVYLEIDTTKQAVPKEPIIEEVDNTVNIYMFIGAVGMETYFHNYIKNSDILSTYIGTPSTGLKWPSVNPAQDSKFLIKAAPATSIFEIIGRFTGDIKYTVRYLIKPKPIILVGLPDDLSIDGYKSEMECELDSELHPEILQRAVELAKAAYIGDLNTQIAVGQASQTNIGIVPQQKE